MRQRYLGIASSNAGSSEHRPADRASRLGELADDVEMVEARQHVHLGIGPVLPEMARVAEGLLDPAPGLPPAGEQPDGALHLRLAPLDVAALGAKDGNLVLALTGPFANLSAGTLSGGGSQPGTALFLAGRRQRDR